LLPFKTVQSNGDHGYDVTQIVTGVKVGEPIAASIFHVPASTQIQTQAPVSVPIAERQGHYFASVSIRGHDYEFLIDTGAQGVVVDSRVAAELVLIPKGRLEVSGATRTGGLGIAELGSIGIGGATLPMRVVSVLDLNSATGGGLPIDGILGYPFFAAAEVRIDPDRLTMTIGKPGSLAPLGTKFDVDVDRERAEIHASVNRVSANFVVDTGDSSELLIFSPFLREHPGFVPFEDRPLISSFGVGGSMRALAATIDELDLGPFHLYNRRAALIQATSGAFADRFDAGNIGMETLQNFVSTFDLADDALYLERGARYDDGRDRSVTGNSTLTVPSYLPNTL
ncbi:MAG: aspartyl protease family protein, partial [Rhodanobacteraceae bacterium]